HNLITMLILSTNYGGTMMEEPKEDPAQKMRKLIGSNSPLTRLPKKNEQSEVKNEASPPKKASIPTNPPVQVSNSTTTSKPKVEPVSSAKVNPSLSIGTAPKSTNKSSIFGPRFWSLASVISLTINGITLLALLISAI